VFAPRDRCKPLKNVDDAGLELPVEDEEGEMESDAAVGDADFDRLRERIEEALGDRVTEVGESRLLADHPCRLVSPEGGSERDLQRVRRLLGQEAEVPARILEVNRRHLLIQNLADRIVAQSGDGLIDPVIEQLFENLSLLEGLHPNPARMVPRIQALLEAATRSEEQALWVFRLSEHPNTARSRLRHMNSPAAVCAAAPRLP
jgi:molecular chaperone HtpG